MGISDLSSDVCSSDLKWKADTLDVKWSAIRSAREEVTEAIEPLRREKTIRSSLEAEVSMGEIAEAENIDFAEICIVAKVDMQPGSEGDRKSVVWGKSVSVRVDLGGRRIINKKKNEIESARIYTIELCI